MLRMATELKNQNQLLLAINDILEQINFAEIASESDDVRTNAEILFRLTNFLISEENWEAARTSVQNMLNVSSTLPESQKHPIRAFAQIQTKILNRWTDKPTVSLMTNNAHNPVTETSGYSCMDGSIQWINEIIKGNGTLANEIASEFWARGSRGQPISFFSKQLGLPYPPNPE